MIDLSIGFFDELEKIAIKIPSLRHVMHLANPSTSGYVKPPNPHVRISGGASNVGFSRPPTPSTAYAGMARKRPF